MRRTVSIMTVVGLTIVVTWCINLYVLQKMGIDRNDIVDTTFRERLSSSLSEREVAASKKAIDVVFGLSGDESGTLSEFEVALKSLLLNGPSNSHTNLRIHILCDNNAFNAIAITLDQTELNGSLWINPISITSYNVQPYEDEWKDRIKELVRGPVKQCRHTFGTYYRLFAHEVLPKSVRSALYMDTDVVIMSNINHLWRHIDAKSLFHWGNDRCAGFIIINNSEFHKIWDYIRQIDFNHAEYIRYKGINDQDILEKVHDAFPHIVGSLPQEWTISLANGAWKYAKNIVTERPKVGMLHLNGGKGNTNAYFDTAGMWTTFPNTWGLIYYYVSLPWTWARFMGESKIEEKGFPLEVRLKNTTVRIPDSRSQMIPCSVREKFFNGSFFSTEMLNFTEEQMSILENILEQEEKERRAKKK